MEVILSKTNKKIKNVVSLVKSKKERFSQGLFVLEGLKVLTEALKNKIEVQEIFVTQKFLKNNLQNSNSKKNLDIFRFVNNQNISVNIITEEICKKISENVVAQELFAVCKMKKEEKLHEILNSKDSQSSGSQTVVMLLNLQDPGNFGTIVRTCEALGVDRILVSENCPDFHSPKVLRSTMGAVFGAKITRLDSEINSEIKIIKKLQSSGFKVFASALGEKSEDVRNIHWGSHRKNVIIIGNEGQGLQPEIIQACDKVVKIPMKEGVDSLNAAVATGILIWELKSKN